MHAAGSPLLWFALQSHSGRNARTTGPRHRNPIRESNGKKAAFPHFFAALRDVLQSRAIVLTSLVEAAQYLVFGAVEAFLALYAASIGIPPWQIGIILGVQLLSVIVVKPGAASDRFGRRAIIVPGLLLKMASVALLPLTGNVAALCVLSVLYGVAFATVTSSTTALVADVSKSGHFGASGGCYAPSWMSGRPSGRCSPDF